jgi:hypothetical protein
MLDRHFAKHGSPVASLAAIGSASLIKDDPVQAVPKPDVIASLGHARLVLGRHPGDSDARPRRAAITVRSLFRKPVSILIRRPSGGNGRAGI